MENKVIKKRNRPKSKGKSEYNEYGYNVTYNEYNTGVFKKSKKAKYDVEENNTEYDGTAQASALPDHLNTKFDNEESIEVLKVGKNWASTPAIEVINTSGKVEYCDTSGIVISLVDDSLCILDTQNFKKLRTITQKDEEIISFAKHPKKSEVVCCMSNSLIRVFDLDSLKCTHYFKIYKTIITKIKFDPSAKFLALLGANKAISLYECETKQLLKTFFGHDGIIYDMCFNPDPNMVTLYSGSDDTTIKVWNILLENCQQTLKGHKTSVRHITLSNDGKSLISVSSDSTIILWKLSNYEIIKTYTLEVPIECIYYFSRKPVESKGDLVPYLMLGCETGEVIEYNLKNPKASKSIFLINQAIQSMHFSLESKTVNFLTSDQMFVKGDYDLLKSSIDEVKNIKFIPGYCQEVLDIKILKNNADKDFKFLFSSNDNNLKYYDTSTGQVQIYEGHSDFIMTIDIKQEYIVTGSKDNTVRLWRHFVDEAGVFQCICLAVFTGHTENINSVCLMVKNGIQIASGGKDKSVKLWNFVVGNEDENEPVVIKESYQSEIGHSDEIMVIRAAPNDKLFATGSFDKSIKIWDRELRSNITLTGHKRGITDISFSKYAKLLASSSTDKTIKIWNLTDGSCLNTLTGHLSSVLKVQWIYYGTYILSGGADGLLKIWNLKNSDCVNTIPAHEGRIWALDVFSSEDFSQETNSELVLRFCTGSTDSKILVWDDVTSKNELTNLTQIAERYQKQEKLRLYELQNDFYPALKLSLELNHKRDFINIFKNFISNNIMLSSNDSEHISMIIANRQALELDDDEAIEKNIKENNVFDPVSKIKNLFKDKELIQIIRENTNKILEIIRDANIPTSSFLYSQILLKLVLTTQYYEKFDKKEDLGTKNKKLKAKKDLKKAKEEIEGNEAKDRKNTIDYHENFEIVKSYSLKHLDRINREYTKSFLIDYLLDKMKMITDDLKK